jgi:hypothetical protein
MTSQHKAALATGRAEGRIVRDYLEALRTNRPKRGRKRTADTIKKRLVAIAKELNDADALTELKLVQEQMDLETELAGFEEVVDLSGLEADFIRVARNYSERQGITYTAWRKVGVEPRVLKAAGIERTAN